MVEVTPQIAAEHRTRTAGNPNQYMYGGQNVAMRNEANMDGSADWSQNEQEIKCAKVSLSRELGHDLTCIKLLR